ncbi:hypothetical protein GCM10012275_43360 [Longimycelium tulufanense]|uniref:Adenylate kinase n=1 Tax=Longimycelium tulufanense TaxID=907463 RepID=A0A8J3CFK9_9PSEU|nr:AAA family ATPase [Longimycelium tulufanense]GGM68139.1 hypothetical protein GCM10012275_43360 [Longimycelium tulufanense]
MSSSTREGTAATPLRLVAVVGPPGVGKSTATGVLTRRLGARVWRLREAAAAYQRAHPGATHLFRTTDPLGWLPDLTVEVLLAAFLRGRRPSGLVVLEGFPGSARQLHMLCALAAGLPVGVLALDASDRTCEQRAQGRRVCAVCEPDPRRPAPRHPQDPERCARCRHPLVRRHSDATDRFQDRLHRYRVRAPLIRSMAHRLGVPHQVITVEDGPEACRDRVLTAAKSLSVSTPGGPVISPAHL